MKFARPAKFRTRRRRIECAWRGGEAADRDTYFGVWSSCEDAHSSAWDGAFRSSARFSSASLKSESTTTIGVKTAVVPRASSVHMVVRASIAPKINPNASASVPKIIVDRRCPRGLAYPVKEPARASGFGSIRTIDATSPAAPARWQLTSTMPKSSRLKLTAWAASCREALKCPSLRRAPAHWQVAWRNPTARSRSIRMWLRAEHRRPLSEFCLLNI